MTALATERLLLRRARPEDLAAIHAILSDPRAMAYWSTTPHETIERSRAWLRGMIASPPELSEDFVIELEGRVIGKAGCYRLPEIGYILHPDMWGRGYAREAVGAVIDHIFASRAAIDAICADVDPRNGASIRLLERLGFERSGFAERTFEIGGVWMDSFYFTLPRNRRAAVRDA